MISVKPPDKPIESQADSPQPRPTEDSALEELKPERPLSTGSGRPLKTPAASDLNNASSLLQKACYDLSENDEVLHAYRKVVVPKLKEDGLIDSDNSRLDIQQATEWLKSRVDLPKGKEVLNNIVTALSSFVQVLSPAASVEPHIALVCTGLSIILLVSLFIIACALMLTLLIAIVECHRTARDFI